MGRDCSKGSAGKGKKFTTSSGRGNSCSTLFTCSALERSSEEYARESRDKLSSGELPSVQQDSINVALFFTLPSL